VAFIGGPSGAGKSVLLRTLAAALRRSRTPVIAVAEPHGGRCAVDAVGPTLEDALRLLARAGLAEVDLLGRRPAELSRGQRARLALALAMDRAARAGPGAWVLGDEWAAPLDRLAAMGVSVSASGWARSAGVRLVAAASQDDVKGWLAPDLAVRVELGGVTHVEHRVLGDRPGNDRGLSGAGAVPLRGG
jgi:ABC-type ATPase with predicted acetyltransferase domain